MPKATSRRPARGEFSLIAALERELSRVGSSAVEVGIGDDAAVLLVGKKHLVVTVDEQIEGVHFDLRWLSAADVGYRALQAAASDLAAMGASPLSAVVSLRVPPAFPQAELNKLARGQAAAARELACPVVGGNVARDSKLSLTTTVLGLARKPLLRRGARVGDELWVLGELGLARAGLLLHQQRPKVPARFEKVARRARAAWARPRALINDGLNLVGRARAAIDVSDGLAGDVRHLADHSRVKAVLEARLLSRYMAEDLAGLGELLGEPGVSLALTGGEDYALLAAGPKGRRPVGAKVVGRMEGGRGSELELEAGRRVELRPGFDHLRR